MPNLYEFDRDRKNVRQTFIECLEVIMNNGDDLGEFIAGFEHGQRQAAVYLLVNPCWLYLFLK